MAEAHLTHGCARKNRLTPEYITWAAIRSRCINPKNKSYHRYGGRGIRVCGRWQDFAAFLADMGQKPSPRYQIERIDNDGHYEPGNCRWATVLEQANNRRSNTMLPFRGESLTLAQWARRTGISEKVLSARLGEGWSVERMLTTSVRGKSPLSRHDREKAKSAVCRAVRKGALPRAGTLDCSSCGSRAALYHHHQGYDRGHWLDVVPLCRSCQAATLCEVVHHPDTV